MRTAARASCVRTRCPKYGQQASLDCERIAPDSSCVNQHQWPYRCQHVRLRELDEEKQPERQTQRLNLRISGHDVEDRCLSHQNSEAIDKASDFLCIGKTRTGTFPDMWKQSAWTRQSRRRALSSVRTSDAIYIVSQGTLGFRGREAAMGASKKKGRRECFSKATR